ncbi:hypothetical protein E4K72_00345 [Oxalobacteraceae bacterium OM1]|nr:hypothetical protein E4K72_00345 [Oxalobacteraceae bacterium OM1]
MTSIPSITLEPFEFITEPEASSEKASSFRHHATAEGPYKAFLHKGRNLLLCCTRPADTEPKPAGIPEPSVRQYYAGAPAPWLQKPKVGPEFSVEAMWWAWEWETASATVGAI